jgi:hypothetical protein
MSISPPDDPAAAPDAGLPAQDLRTPPAPLPAGDNYDQQLGELRATLGTLVDAVGRMQAQTTRDAAFRGLTEDIRTSLATLHAPVAAPRAAEIPREGVKDDCGESPCGCVSSSCCCFDIVMTYVRVLAMQPLELVDSNANPWAEIEVKMFAHINGVGAVIPSMFSTLSLRKLVSDPGLKVTIGRTIGNVCLKKGRPKMITITVDAIEEDSGLAERATGGRDEEGSSSGTMVLDCCCSTPPTLAFDIPFTSGGQGRGAIEVGFTAVRTC